MLNHSECAETIYRVKNALEILILRDFLWKGRTERKNFSQISNWGTKIKFQEMKLEYLHYKYKMYKHKYQGSPEKGIKLDCWNLLSF